VKDSFPAEENLSLLILLSKNSYRHRLYLKTGQALYRSYDMTLYFSERNAFFSKSSLPLLLKEVNYVRASTDSTQTIERKAISSNYAEFNQAKN